MKVQMFTTGLLFCPENKYERDELMELINKGRTLQTSSCYKYDGKIYYGDMFANLYDLLMKLSFLYPVKIVKGDFYG